MDRDFRLSPDFPIQLFPHTHEPDTGNPILFIPTEIIRREGKFKNLGSFDMANIMTAIIIHFPAGKPFNIALLASESGEKVKKVSKIIDKLLALGYVEDISKLFIDPTDDNFYK